LNCPLADAAYLEISDSEVEETKKVQPGNIAQ
jgi:uncharacterized protein YuzE